MAKRKRFHGFYEGYEGRRQQESADSGMIQEDKSAIANLPQQVIMKYWPQNIYTMPENLDDTIRVVDNQMHDDAQGGKRKKDKYPEKY